MPSLLKITLKFRAIPLGLPCALMCCLSMSILFSQNNLPVDLQLVTNGVYKAQVDDSLNGVTKTHKLIDIPDFYMSTSEVSVQDYAIFCKETGHQMPPEPDWGWDDPKLPVVNVTLNDAKAYCNWWSGKTKIDARLPRLEEWTFVAGVAADDDQETVNRMDSQVVYASNSREKPKCITCMQPNAIGFYATLGNVWEWVEQPFFTQHYDSIFGETLKLNNSKTFWAGGSFFEDATNVQPQSLMPIQETVRRQDVGFRLVAEATSFKKGMLLQKVQQLLDQIFEDQKVVANTSGIFIEEQQDGHRVEHQFLWETIPHDTVLSYDATDASVFFCCVQSANFEDPEVIEWLAMGFKVPDKKAEAVFDLMHLLNVEPGNLDLLKAH